VGNAIDTEHDGSLTLCNAISYGFSVQSGQSCLIHMEKLISYRIENRLYSWKLKGLALNAVPT
jgi:hypothetical protein